MATVTNIPRQIETQTFDTFKFSSFVNKPSNRCDILCQLTSVFGKHMCYCCDWSLMLFEKWNLASAFNDSVHIFKILYLFVFFKPAYFQEFHANILHLLKIWLNEHRNFHFACLWALLYSQGSHMGHLLLRRIAMVANLKAPILYFAICPRKNLSEYMATISRTWMETHKPFPQIKDM